MAARTRPTRPTSASRHRPSDQVTSGDSKRIASATAASPLWSIPAFRNKVFATLQGRPRRSKGLVHHLTSRVFRPEPRGREGDGVPRLHAILPNIGGAFRRESWPSFFRVGTLTPWSRSG